MAKRPAKADKPADPVDQPQCGLVMPISPLDGCSAEHWAEVKTILVDAISAAGFKAEFVSYADEVSIIQKTIVQNLYENPIVVCDVSGKNPNVMFELGLRLAFDKPTIIVKDDATDYSFDTSPIEHLKYPRSLRHAQINQFKSQLTDKIKGTIKAAGDADYSPFLKHFGRFTVAKLETTEVSKDAFILEELRELKQIIKADRSSPDRGTWKTLNIRESLGRDVTFAVLRDNLQKTIAQLAKETGETPDPLAPEVVARLRSMVAESFRGMSESTFRHYLACVIQTLPDRKQVSITSDFSPPPAQNP